MTPTTKKCLLSWFKGKLRRKMYLGLIKHWYLVNRSLRFVFMIIKC